jgi:hypothetical protein
MTAACLLVRFPACYARQLQTNIVQVVRLRPTGFREGPWERLERHKPKGLRVVLRGGGGGDATSLPDPPGEQSPGATRPGIRAVRSRSRPAPAGRPRGHGAEIRRLPDGGGDSRGGRPSRRLRASTCNNMPSDLRSKGPGPSHLQLARGYGPDGQGVAVRRRPLSGHRPA